MELVEGRKQSKREGEKTVELVAHIDQLSYTSAQQNPQGVLELPFYLAALMHLNATKTRANS